MVCFMVEAWERASYYGMRALLTLYTMNVVLATAGEVDSVWGMRLVAPLAGVPGDEVTGLEREKAAQEAASRLYGFYTALVYLTPTLGGFIADNYVGQQRMVLIGGAIMAAGHTLLAYRPAFLVALLLLIIGNGAFKPNLTVMLGRLYVDTGATREESDPDAWAKRNAAFQLFYVGINLGAFVSPLVCGELKAVFGSGPSDPAGYHAGFVAAGVGMLVSLAIFLAGRRYVPPDEIKRPQRLPSRASARRYETIASPQRGRPNAASKASGSGKGGGAWAILTRYRVRTLAYLLACVILVPFWSVFEQGGNTVAVFASEAVALGAIPVEWVQSVNPLFVIALTPVVQGAYSCLRARGWEPSTLVKLGCGPLTVALGQLVMAAGAATTTRECDADQCVYTQRANIFWLVLSIMLTTLGELQTSPVGLAFTAEVAPSGLGSLFMGFWMATNFFANLGAGLLGASYSTLGPPAFFAMLAVIGAATGLVMLAMRAPLQRALAAPPRSL